MTSEQQRLVHSVNCQLDVHEWVFKTRLSDGQDYGLLRECCKHCEKKREIMAHISEIEFTCGTELKQILADIKNDRKEIYVESTS